MTVRPALRVRTAGVVDTAGVLEVLRPVIASTAMSRWLHPSAGTRGRLVGEGVTTLVDGAATGGDIRVVEAGRRVLGAAIWAPCTARRCLLHDLALTPIPGPDGERRRQLAAALSRRRPRAPHDHLLVIGVLPEHQRSGLGTALLADWHGRPAVDPSYVLANDAVAGLVRRFGYHPIGRPIRPSPAAPALRPMWRADVAAPRHRPAEAAPDDVYWPTNRSYKDLDLP